VLRAVHCVKNRDAGQSIFASIVGGEAEETKTNFQALTSVDGPIAVPSGWLASGEEVATNFEYMRSTLS
jgi:hypothetical protein